VSYVDKKIKCTECGVTFNFGASEQELFASRGYTNEPKRCPECRERRKQQRGGSYHSPNGSGDVYGYQRKRSMYPAVCASCGRETEVPFQPQNERPVYCRDCFAKIRPKAGV